MSTATELTRIQTARNTIRDKAVELGIAQTTAKIDVLATAISGIENRGAVSAQVKEGDTYIIPKGYHNGSGTVSGVSGGGSGFTVSAYSALPASGSENEIAIITDTAIPAWVFTAAEPTTRADGTPLAAGDLWVQTGGAGVSFNALAENGLIVQPYRAYQYIDGAWVQKDAYIYQNGEWVPWTVYLFHNGIANESLTGGINGTVQDGTLYFSATVTKSNNKTYTTKSPIDLTNVNYIKARMMSTLTLSSAYFRLLVIDSAKDGATPGTSALEAYVQEESPFSSKEREVVLDVSDITGEWYVGYCWGVLSSSSGSRAITGYIYDWWLE